MEAYIVLKLSLLLVSVFLIISGCGSQSADYLIDKVIPEANNGNLFAKVGTYSLSKETVWKEYRAYIKSYFPKHMQNTKLKDLNELNQYGEKMALQYLMIHGLQNINKKTGVDPLMARAALRQALSELYLNSKVDLTKVVQSKAFQKLNKDLAEQLYKKNKAKYDKQKIKKEKAVLALQYVIFNKRKQILSDYASKVRFNTIKELVKRNAYDLKKFNKIPSEN